MLSDVLNIIVSLPSQHVIFGIISTVLCIAVAWVYSSSYEKTKKVTKGVVVALSSEAKQKVIKSI